MSDTTHNVHPTSQPSGPNRSAAMTFDESFQESYPDDDFENDFGEGPEGDDPHLIHDRAPEIAQQPPIANLTPSTPVPENVAGGEEPHSVSGMPEKRAESVLTENTIPNQAIDQEHPIDMNSPSVLSENTAPNIEAGGAIDTNLSHPSVLSENTNSDLEQGEESPADKVDPSVLTENTDAVQVAEITDDSLPPPQTWVWQQPEVGDAHAATVPTRTTPSLEDAFMGDAMSGVDEVGEAPESPTTDFSTNAEHGTIVEPPSPDEINLPFYVRMENGELTADSVAYRRNPDGFYKIDPGDMQRDEVKGYLEKGIISERLATRTLNGTIVPVQAGHQSASDFLKEQSDYYACDEEVRKLREWPILDPETTSTATNAPTHGSAPQSNADALAPPPSEEHLPPFPLNSGGSPGRPAKRKLSEGEKLIAELDLVVATQRSGAVQEITASERARFLDIRHTSRKEISRRSGVKPGMLTRAKLAAAAALGYPQKDKKQDLSQRASSLGIKATRDIGNIRHISAAVSPAFRNAVLSYESTAHTLKNGIQALNKAVLQHPDFPELSGAISKCMTTLSAQGPSPVTAEMVISAANDISIVMPSLDKVRDAAKKILESDPDLMLISTSTNLLAQKLARHSREIGNGIIGLKQSGVPERDLRKIEGALDRFRKATSDIETAITPNSGTSLLRDTLSYMREMSDPDYWVYQQTAHGRPSFPLEHEPTVNTQDLHIQQPEP